MENTEKNRMVNIELLRILAMVGIIMAHFSFHGGFNFPLDNISVNRLWTQLLIIFGKTSANVFVIISGYFLIASKKFNPAKLIRLWLQIFTYSVTIYFIFVLTGREKFGILNAIKRFMPITFEQWWFASTYFMLYLLYPFLNILLSSLSKHQYKFFLIVLTVCWSVIPTLTTMPMGSNDLLWFIYLYALSGYLRLYPLNVKSHSCFLSATVVFLLIFLSIVVFDLIGERIPIIGENATVFSGEQKLPALVLSVLIFEAFEKMNIEKCTAFINVTASATFGIYLLHDDEYFRTFLWQDVFKNADFQSCPFLIPYSVFVVSAVFTACAVIELIRTFIIEKCYNSLLERLSVFLKGFAGKLASSEFFNKF